MKNQKPMYMAVAGILVAGMVAVPVFSKRAQEPGQAPNVKIQKKIVRVQQDPAIETVEEFNDSDDNVEMLLGNGGSWLGVETREVSPESMKELKLPAERGVLVGKVMDESPAAKGGLKAKDVITEINGQRVEGTAQFRRMLHEIPPGRATQLTVWREGHSQSLSVTLGKSEPKFFTKVMTTPGSFDVRVPDFPKNMPNVEMIPDVPDFENFNFYFNDHPRLGIAIEELNGQLGNYFGAPNGEGILVESVDEGSAAEKAGLKAGDVITKINGEPIHKTHELRERLHANAESKPLNLTVLRNKSEMSISVTLPPAEKKREMKLSHRPSV